MERVNGWKFNLSYSSFSSYKASQLLFYFSYIKGELPTNKVYECYGAAGQCVHETCDAYIKDRSIDVELTFNIKWKEKKLNSLLAMNNKPLNQQSYFQYLKKAIKYVDEHFPEGTTVAEDKFEFRDSEYDDIIIKGFIDVRKDVGKDVEIYDWKTNSISGNEENDYAMHHTQRLFYSWLYWLHYKIIPTKCCWIYLKDMSEHCDTFTEEEIKLFDEEIRKFIKEVKEKGENIGLYDIGDTSGPFNAYKSLCLKEINRRKNLNTIVATLKNNKLTFDELPDKLAKAMDIKYSYFVPGYEFSELYRKHVWDGKKHLFKNNTIPYTFINDFKKMLEDYNQHFKVNYSLHINDERNQEIINKIFTTKFGECEYELRDYQLEAVNAAINYKVGILYIGTSGGKTFIAGEIIKRLNRRTLFLTDRIELVRQTSKELEDYLGVKVGQMYEGKLSVNHQITVAGIQTVCAILKRKNEETQQLRLLLHNITLLITDEIQRTKNDGMYGEVAKQMSNVDYIIGLSGSPWRN